MESKTFTVPNIGCDGCVRTIVSELSKQAGVSKVTGDQNTKRVTVQFAPPASWDTLKAALVAIDYAPADA